MRKAKLPLNPDAVKAADKALYDKHPELGGRKLTTGPEDGSLRQEWMDSYLANGGQAADPPAPQPPGAIAAPCPERTNGPFDSVDEAARAALEAANPDSIRDNLEYSGLIYTGADGRYYFTGPAQGTDQGANPFTDAPVPPGTTMAGIYHTHGDYSLHDPSTGAAIRTSDPARDDFNSDHFSTTDEQTHTIKGVPGYLGTPSGTFRKHDPATGDHSTL